MASVCVLMPRSKPSYGGIVASLIYREVSKERPLCRQRGKKQCKFANTIMAARHANPENQDTVFQVEE